MFVWDVDGHKAAWTLSAAAPPRELAFSPDGGRLAVGVGREDEAVPDDGNRVEVWDTATRKEPLAVLRNQGRLPDGVAFSPDGARLAVVWKGPKDERLRSTTPAQARKPPPWMWRCRPRRGADRSRCSCGTAGG